MKMPANFYQASSGDMYGKLSRFSKHMKRHSAPQARTAVRKCTVSGKRSTTVKLTCNGILCGHESPRRGETFVRRKTTQAPTSINLGLPDKLYLGNLDTKQDPGVRQVA